jgi:hypothetical protein
VDIGRIRHFDVFVAVEMYLLVASDILAIDWTGLSIRVEVQLAYTQRRYIKV